VSENLTRHFQNRKKCNKFIPQKVGVSVQTKEKEEVLMEIKNHRNKNSSERLYRRISKIVQFSHTHYSKLTHIESKIPQIQFAFDSQ
jgi:hypothetical protein